MKNCAKIKTRYILGIDPSGNFNEGKGTTGWAVFDRKEDKFIRCSQIQASKFTTQEAYWYAHERMILDTINEFKKDGIAISMEDFVLYATSAKAQINSGMETSQLIGVIKMVCYKHRTPLYMRTASRVKRRWTDTILCNNGWIYQVGSKFYTDCCKFALSDHTRDAIRHAVHCAIFEIGKEEHDEYYHGRNDKDK